MRTIAISGALLILLSPACFAADNPKVTLDAKDLPIEQAIADLAKQAEVQIICESGIKGTVTGRFESIELEKLLGVISKTNSLTWQKLYLPPPPEDQKPTLDQMKARADAVAAVTGGPIVVVDPATGKQKVYVEQEASAPSVDPEKLGLKPIYLVSKPKAAPKTAGTAETDKEASSRFQALQNERIQLLAKMSPEQRVAAMQAEMLAVFNMDPSARTQFMADQMKARFSMDPQMRDQYRQLMQDTFHVMRDQGQIPSDGGGWFGGGRGNRGDRGDRGNRGDRVDRESRDRGNR